MGTSSQSEANVTQDPSRGRSKQRGSQNHDKSKGVNSHASIAGNRGISKRISNISRGTKKMTIVQSKRKS